VATIAAQIRPDGHNLQHKGFDYGLVSKFGFPRHRETRNKTVLEAFWSGQITADEMSTTTAAIAKGNWVRQQQAGLDFIPMSEFSCMTACWIPP
jgi:hypothetical protein